MVPTHWVVPRLGALGDVTLVTGVLNYWAMRGVTFTVVTRQAFAPIFAGHPAVRDVVELTDLSFPAVWRCWQELATRHKGHGLADLHGTPRTRLLGMLWKGPVRRYPKFALERRAFLTSRGRLCGERLLEWNVPQRYAMAVPELCTGIPDRAELRPTIFLSEEERRHGTALLASAGLKHPETQRPVALHPYATHANKAWSHARWQELATGLDAAGLPWIVVGRNQTPALPQAGARDFTNRTTLRETCALLQHCRALITGDSGPMHLASAVNTPVLALFGPTTAHWGFFPCGPHDIILERDLDCRPCGLHGGKTCNRGLACMDIDPQDLIQRLLL